MNRIEALMNSLLFLLQLRNTLLLQYGGRCFNTEASTHVLNLSSLDLIYPQVSFSKPKIMLPFPSFIVQFFTTLKEVHLVVPSSSLQTSPLALPSRQLWEQTLQFQEAAEKFKTARNLLEDILLAMKDEKADVSLLQEAILHDSSLFHKAYNMCIPITGQDDKEDGIETFSGSRAAKRTNSNFLSL